MSVTIRWPSTLRIVASGLMPARWMIPLVRRGAVRVVPMPVKAQHSSSCRFQKKRQRRAGPIDRKPETNLAAYWRPAAARSPPHDGGLPVIHKTASARRANTPAFSMGCEARASRLRSLIA